LRAIFARKGTGQTADSDGGKAPIYPIRIHKPQFDRAGLGFASHHQGDALVDLDSVDLTAAKNDLQAKYVQWQRDLRVLKLQEKLVDDGAVSQQTYIANIIDMFERRKVTVAQENSDFVVIATGLEAGESVATSGNLVLA